MRKLPTRTGSAIGALMVGLMMTGSVTIASTTAASASTLPSSSPTGLFIQRWSATHMAGDQTSYTLTQALTIAQNFNVIVVQARTFAPYVVAMHQINPNLKIFVYLNSSFSAAALGYPSSWYAHDANGNLITSIMWHNYLMDMSQPAWAQYQAQSCATLVAVNRFDGCYFDLLNTAIFNPGYVTALPIDPVTGTTWTAPDWINALVQAIGAFHSGNAGLPIMGNVLGGFHSYFNTDGTSSYPVLSALGAGHAEDFLRSAQWPATQYPTQKGWLGAINAMVDAESHGNQVMTQTKLWATATAAQVDAWHRFAVASFLLATNGSSYFTFSTDHTAAALTADSPYDRVNVGTPVDSFSFSGGLYRRDFTKGVALVNSTSSTVTVGLTANYVDLGGVSYPSGSSITLGPDTADVLVNS